MKRRNSFDLEGRRYECEGRIVFFRDCGDCDGYFVMLVEVFVMFFLIFISGIFFFFLVGCICLGKFNNLVLVVRIYLVWLLSGLLLGLRIF